jgi:D-xylose transport system substrate-binding protein
MQAAIEAGGGTYISNDAKSSAETQATNIENLMSQGANVLVVLAQDGTAVKPSVTSAIEAGVPVIAYDRLIEDPGVLYITFDNVKVGRAPGRGRVRPGAVRKLRDHEGQLG